MTEFTQILYAVQGRTAIITFNRPGARNAANARLVAEASRALEMANQDRNVRAIILTGAPPAFMSGADIKELSSLAPEEALGWMRNVGDLALALERCGIPSIAAVNGPAMGGGFELALACTLRVADQEAIFGLPEVKIGLIPGAGGIERLCRLAGKGIAAELALTGRRLEAAEAKALGVVNRLAPPGQALEAALELAGQIAALPATAVSLAKEAVENALSLGLEQALDASLKACVLAFNTADRREGMSAFLGKRPPKFSGG